MTPFRWTREFIVDEQRLRAIRMSAVTSMTAVLTGLAALATLCASEAAPRVLQDCPDCPRMVEISGGSFTMGSPPTERERKKFEGPREHVTVGDFLIGEAEVTRAQYATFVRDTQRPDPPGCFTFGFISFADSVLDTNASWHKLPFNQTDDHPVVCVSWNDAKDYVAWLSRKTGHIYRLPSEAEWEYAARAGTTTIFFWGTDENQACEYANGGDARSRRAVVPRR
jgi:formylglycine-generating enzyme required for sulfatase activity